MTRAEVESLTGWPRRDAAGRVRRESAWVGYALWAVALAAWALAIASVK